MTDNPPYPLACPPQQVPQTAAAAMSAPRHGAVAAPAMGATGLPFPDGLNRVLERAGATGTLAASSTHTIDGARWRGTSYISGERWRVAFRIIPESPVAAAEETT